MNLDFNFPISVLMPHQREHLEKFRTQILPRLKQDDIGTEVSYIYIVPTWYLYLPCTVHATFNDSTWTVHAFWAMAHQWPYTKHKLQHAQIWINWYSSQRIIRVLSRSIDVKYEEYLSGLSPSIMQVHYYLQARDTSQSRHLESGIYGGHLIIFLGKDWPPNVIWTPCLLGLVSSPYESCTFSPSICLCQKILHFTFSLQSKKSDEARFSKNKNCLETFCYLSQKQRFCGHLHGVFYYFIHGNQYKILDFYLILKTFSGLTLR